MTALLQQLPNIGRTGDGPVWSGEWSLCGTTAILLAVVVIVALVVFAVREIMRAG